MDEPRKSDEFVWGGGGGGGGSWNWSGGTRLGATESAQLGVKTDDATRTFPGPAGAYCDVFTVGIQVNCWK
jgi:hypothetical protein